MDRWMLIARSGAKRTHCIGALVDSNRTIVILQIGVETMIGEPSPFFTDMLAFLRGEVAFQFTIGLTSKPGCGLAPIR